MYNTLKKQLLILAPQPSRRVERFCALLEDTYTMHFVKSCKEAEEEIVAHPDDHHALIVDNPSNIEGFADLITSIQEQNDFMLCLAVLVLTDVKCRDADEDFLGKTVIATIDEFDSKKAIIQRIEQSSVMLNSMSFQDFAKILKSLPIQVYLKDVKGRYVFCSQRWHHIVGEEDMRGKTDLEVRKSRDNAEMAYNADMRLIKSGKGETYTIEDAGEDGAPAYFEVVKEPLFGKNGHVRGIVALVYNVTEQETLRRKHRQQSITDQLTGLYNRLYFNEFIESIGQSQRPISIITADCDNLKEINDRYGHQMGDRYICATADILINNTPEDAVKIRTGGDEFIVVLTKCNADQAQAYVQKLRNAVSETKINDIQLEVSLGFATIVTSTDTIENCLIESDEAMYADKKNRKAKHHS